MLSDLSPAYYTHLQYQTILSVARGSMSKLEQDFQKASKEFQRLQAGMLCFVVHECICDLL